MKSGSDIRASIDAFIVAVHKRAQASDYAEAARTDDIAKDVGISEHLAEKIATFLEQEGFMDYEDQAVDITVEGILRAEEILRAGAQPPAPVQRARTTTTKPRR